MKTFLDGPPRETSHHHTSERILLLSFPCTSKISPFIHIHAARTSRPSCLSIYSHFTLCTLDSVRAICVIPPLPIVTLMGLASTSDFHLETRPSYVASCEWEQLRSRRCLGKHSSSAFFILLAACRVSCRSWGLQTANDSPGSSR